MEAQEAFKGEAECLGLKSEQDVVDIIKQIRKDLKEEKMRIMADTYVSAKREI